MLQLRRLDAAGRQAYLEEVRPRLVVVRIRARGRRLLWAVPLWPFEQLLALALGLALLAPGALRLVPLGVRGRAGESASKFVASASTQAAALLGRPEPGSLLQRLSLLAGGGLGDALRLPPGEPYVSVRTDEADLEITLI